MYKNGVRKCIYRIMYNKILLNKTEDILNDKNSKFHLFNELKIGSGNNKNKLWLLYALWYK